MTYGRPTRTYRSAPAAPPHDSRAVHHKRVQDLVTINDALKDCHAKNGAYPNADGFAGASGRRAVIDARAVAGLPAGNPTRPDIRRGTAICRCVGRRKLQAACSGRVACRKRQCRGARHKDRPETQPDAEELRLWILGRRIRRRRIRYSSRSDTRRRSAECPPPALWLARNHSHAAGHQCSRRLHARRLPAWAA